MLRYFQRFNRTLRFLQSYTFGTSKQNPKLSLDLIDDLDEETVPPDSSQSQLLTDSLNLLSGQKLAASDVDSSSPIMSPPRTNTEQPTKEDAPRVLNNKSFDKKVPHRKIKPEKPEDIIPSLKYIYNNNLLLDYFVQNSDLFGLNQITFLIHQLKKNITNMNSIKQKQFDKFQKKQ